MTRLRRVKRTIIATVVIVLLVLYALSRAWSWSICSLYGHETRREVRYSPFLGCTVKVGEQWIPRSELRVVQ